MVLSTLTLIFFYWKNVVCTIVTASPRAADYGLSSTVGLLSDAHLRQYVR